jgi:hypothetical protein
MNLSCINIELKTPIMNQNPMKKQLRFLFSSLLFVILISFVLPTNAFSQPEIPTELKEASKFFKENKQSNRINTFKSLQHLIKEKLADVVDEEREEGAVMGTYTTTSKELVSLLGEPDRKVANTIWEYQLNGAQKACKVVIGINKNGEVTFVTIKDCQ